MSKDTIVLRHSDLPRTVEIVSSEGQRVRYTLRAAGRKFGAMLGKPEGA